MMIKKRSLLIYLLAALLGAGTLFVFHPFGLGYFGGPPTSYQPTPKPSIQPSATSSQSPNGKLLGLPPIYTPNSAFALPSTVPNITIDKIFDGTSGTPDNITPTAEHIKWAKAWATSEGLMIYALNNSDQNLLDILYPGWGIPLALGGGFIPPVSGLPRVDSATLIMTSDRQSQAIQAADGGTAVSYAFLIYMEGPVTIQGPDGTIVLIESDPAMYLFAGKYVVDPQWGPVWETNYTILCDPSDGSLQTYCQP